MVYTLDTTNERKLLWSALTGEPMSLAGVIESGAYEHGYCGVLAQDLHTLSGRPIAVLTDDQDDALAFWRHAVLSLGDDQYLDVTGISTRAELIERWTKRGCIVTRVVELPEDRLDEFDEEQPDTAGLTYQMFGESFADSEDVANALLRMAGVPLTNGHIRPSPDHAEAHRWRSSSNTSNIRRDHDKYGGDSSRP